LTSALRSWRHALVSCSSEGRSSRDIAPGGSTPPAIGVQVAARATMQRILARSGITLALLGYSLFAIGCGSTATLPTAPAPAGATQTQRLRIANAGSSSATGLVVVFPNSVRVAFGDVAPGASTQYSDVNGGVYRYAAYRLTVDGAIIDQPVIDWVGEVPMLGNAFTYTIDVDTSRPRGQMIRLVSATRDQ